MSLIEKWTQNDDSSLFDKPTSPPLSHLTLEELGELNDKFKDHIGGLARRTLEASWEWGKVLSVAKNKCSFGQWRRTLVEWGVDKSMAHRLISLYTEFEMSQLETFDSMTQALKAIPRKTTQPKPEPSQVVTEAEQTEPRRGISPETGKDGGLA